jgi:K+-sensing histidine kinase KdpD
LTESAGKLWTKKSNACPFKQPGKKEELNHRVEKIGNREYEVAVAFLSNPDGSMSIIEIFRDITERERLEEEIIQAEVRIESLRQSERLKTDLLSMVSHELRTPLAVIKGYTATLLRNRNKWSEQKLRDYLIDIDQETNYLNKLVGNLLDMSRIESGAMKLEKDWYPIFEILEWVDGALKTTTKSRKLQLMISSDVVNQLNGTLFKPNTLA